MDAAPNVLRRTFAIPATFVEITSLVMFSILLNLGLFPNTGNGSNLVLFTVSLGTRDIVYTCFNGFNFAFGALIALSFSELRERIPLRSSNDTKKFNFPLAGTDDASVNLYSYE